MISVVMYVMPLPDTQEVPKRLQAPISHRKQLPARDRGKDRGKDRAVEVEEVIADVAKEGKAKAWARVKVKERVRAADNAVVKLIRRSAACK